MNVPKERLDTLREVLYEESDLYRLSIPPMGALWDQAWLSGYAQDDRSASMLGQFLTIVSNNLQKMAELTAVAKEYMPAMNKELDVIHKLDDKMIAPVERTYEEMVSRAKREGRYLLLPKEYSDTSYRINSITTYFDYRNGLNVLRTNHFDGEDTRKLLKKYGPAARAFVKKWDWHFSIGDPKEFGFISFLGVDSHDDSNNSPILPKILKAKDPTDVLLNEIPERGIYNVIFADEEKITDGIKHILENREQKVKMCTVSSLKLRLDKNRMTRYIRNFVPRPNSNDEPNPSYVR